MKERPILFSAHMVRAILDDKKTQTRRAIKLPKERGVWEPSIFGGHGATYSDGTRCEEMPCIWNTTTGKTFVCPYGKIGDRLWVRETWQHENYPLGPYESDCQVFYRADYMDDPLGVDLENSTDKLRRKWNPSIHMPREASRILLEITNVRIERLRDISEEDAIAEGVSNADSFNGIGVDDGMANRYAYRELWQSINGQGSWDLNPWVWVIEFSRIISK
ncbi:hypothetical protein C7H79_14255 [Nitrosomonas supralitoralis]|uniref:Morphogenetic protein n=1 Tax=Nitrosomonas supralitoralis TaxID=2116706 RepID=A0A2P7NS83_9PROT|nr:hypothetical protein C7H79_14255 [Nitrosomonas supralitoralis]